MGQGLTVAKGKRGPVVTVAVHLDALEFRIEDDPRPFMAEAEGAYFRDIERLLHHKRNTPLTTGCLADSGYRVDLSPEFRGMPNPHPRGGWIGFDLIEPRTKQIVRFAFDGRQPPSELMQAVLRAFDPEAAELAATAADKEKHHAEGKLQDSDHPRKPRAREAEGPGLQHAEGEPSRPPVQGRKHGRNAKPREVQPGLSKKPAAKRAKAGKEGLRQARVLANKVKKAKQERRAARAAGMLEQVKARRSSS
jgi:hypothetical protein